MLDELGIAADVRGDDGTSAGHGFHDGVGESFADGRQHENVEAAQPSGYGGRGGLPDAIVENAGLAGALLKGLELESAADHHELHLRAQGPDARESVDQGGEAFLMAEAAYGAHKESVRGHRRRARGGGGIELVEIDAVVAQADAGFGNMLIFDDGAVACTGN